MPTSLPHSPDGLGLAAVDVATVDGGWRVAVAVPGDLHGPHGILQGGLSSALPRLAVGAVLDAGLGLPGWGANDITMVHSRLRRPTPVGALLHADVRVEDGEFLVEVRNGDEVTATGTVEVGPPAAVPFIPDLLELSRQPIPPAASTEGFPDCIVCGASNPRGLHLPPHPIGTTGMAVAPWTPDERVDDGHGHVHRLATSAVLDCPGVWAGMYRRGFVPGELFALLGDYRIQWFDDPHLGAELRTVALVDDLTDTRLHVRTAIFEGDRMRALATAVHVFAGALPPVPTPAASLE